MQIFATRVSLLGHMVSKDGVWYGPSKSKAVSDWNKPKTVTKVHSFLGFAMYYERFVEIFSKLALPLISSHDRYRRV